MKTTQTPNPTGAQNPAGRLFGAVIWLGDLPASTSLLALFILLLLLPNALKIVSGNPAGFVLRLYGLFLRWRAGCLYLRGNFYQRVALRVERGCLCSQLLGKCLLFVCSHKEGAVSPNVKTERQPPDSERRA
jgi:hypothetical protein